MGGVLRQEGDVLLRWMQGGSKPLKGASGSWIELMGGFWAADTKYLGLVLVWTLGDMCAGIARDRNFTFVCYPP